MVVDISELEEAAKSTVIRKGTIKVEKGELSFHYHYFPDLPNPFDSAYDSEKKELHILIQRAAFPFASRTMVYKIQIPEGTEKVKVDFRGEDISELSAEDRIEKYFPNLKAERKGLDDKSGYDGYLDSGNE